ncbi:UV excision repair protein rad23 [Coemansia guatemalensis]|uniref:UV excision repair protein RAD23 n=1 Tax=Coemansia guatemalensis TaxID=2761395 RepID=A0A9W8HLS4_9FUNG|nr:UV excision repair protein rad23 [Coemansia guatemalensis]
MADEAAGSGASQQQQQQQQSADAATEGQTGSAQPQGASGNLFHQAEQQQTGQQQAGQHNATGGIPPERLEALRNSEQGRALRALVRNDPNMLEQVLMQMAAEQPGLAQIISSNPQALARLLLDDDDAQGPQAGGEGGAAGGVGNTDTQYIQVTAEEKAAIDRLQELGFSREDVIQAYFACDKNEENAANFLFDEPNNNDMI